MIASAIFVNFVDQDLNVFNRRELVDAVSEIEDMAAIANHTEAVHDLACLGADCLLGAEEGERVHVALKGDLVLNDATCTGHVDRPVEADRIAAGGRDFGEPFAAALREDDGRNNLALVFANEAVEHLAGVAQREALEVAVGEHAAPGVENLNGLSACGDLGVQIRGNGLGVDVKHALEQVGAVLKFCRIQ